jgi:hypothetical protein
MEVALKTHGGGYRLASNTHWGGFEVALMSHGGGFGGRILFSDFCLRFGAACISIRNTENGTWQPLAALAVPWYHRMARN